MSTEEQRQADLRRIVERHKRALLWSMTFGVFELELATVFSQELGISAFHSEDLKRIVREQYIASTRDPSHGEGAVAMRIRQQLGDEIFQSIEDWQKIAFPVDDLDSRYSGWSLILIDLNKAWRRRRSTTRLPLARVDCAPIRVKVRDYLEHHRHTLYELETAADYILSSSEPRWEWDKRVIECSDPEHAVVSSLSGIMSALRAREFWGCMVSMLSADDLASLTKWAHSHLVRIRAGVDYGAPPTEEQMRV